MTAAKKGVRTLHPDYERLAPYWKDCRNVASGQRAMHTAGSQYIERLEEESDNAFTARLKRSNFFNGTWRTIAGLKGMAFRVDPTKELPAAVEGLAKDITLSGVSLNALASNIVEEVLEVGRVGVLVDHPPRENVSGLTVADSERLGLRPTMQFYPTESIRNWRFVRRANAWVLGMVTLGEKEPVGDDEFGHDTEDRYRVLDLDEAGHHRVRVFRVKDDRDELVEGPFYPLLNNTPLDHVPFFIIGATGTGDAIDEPPLIDLVDANIALYQVNSDRRHGLHFTGMPTAVVSGYTPQTEGEKLYVGSTSAWIFPDPNASASFLEFEGKGLSESRDMSADLKQEMAMLGARMLADESRKGVETLGGTQIKHQGENSMLGEIVGHISAGLEQALALFSRWAGHDAEVVYQINRKFLPVPMGPQEVTALVSAWQSGALSNEELFAKFQEGEVIDSTKTFEEHQGQVDAQGPAKPSVAAVAANDPAQAA